MVQAAVPGLYCDQPEGCTVTGLQQLTGPVDRKVGVGIIAMWNYDYFIRYESEDFPGLIENVWSSSIVVDGRERSLEMFYKHLHAYVRARLVQEYNEQGADIKQNGFIPANVLGNMWAQSWGKNI